MKKRVLALVLGLSLVFTTVVGDVSVVMATPAVADQDTASAEEPGEASPETPEEEPGEVKEDPSEETPETPNAPETPEITDEPEAPEEPETQEPEEPEEETPKEEKSTYGAMGSTGELYYLNDDGVKYTVTKVNEEWMVRVSFLDNPADVENEIEAGPFYNVQDYNLVIPASLRVRINGVKQTIYPTIFEGLTYPTGGTLKSVTIAEGYTSVNMAALSHNYDSVSFPSTMVSTVVPGNSHPSDCMQKVSNGRPECAPNWYSALSADSVSYAGKVAIKVPNIANVTFASDTTEIMPFAGLNNDSTVSVSIPDSVKRIGAYSFAGNTSLTTFNISSTSTLEYMGYCTFGYDAGSIREISTYGKAPIQSIYLPGTIMSDDNYTNVTALFNGCSTLSSVTIGAGADCIAYAMFCGCTSLTTFSLPKRVHTIYGKAFEGCTSLATFNISTKSNLKKIVYSAFGYYDVKAGITGHGAPIQKIYIPGAVYSAELDNSALFSGNTALTSVTVGEGAKYIPLESFYNCSNLTSFTLPDSVTTIRCLAFGGCSKLKTFNISEKSQLAYIGFRAFGWNFKDGFTVNGNSGTHTSGTPYTDEANLICAGAPIEEIYLPADAFSSSDSTGLFAGNTALKKVTIGPAKGNSQSLSMSFMAFTGCTSLDTVIGLGNVKTIQGGAFADCTSLKSVDLTGVEYINYATFSNTGLTEVTIPESVKTVAPWAFSDCKSLTKMTIDSACSGGIPPLAHVVGQIYSFKIIDNNDSYKITNIAEYVAKYPNATPLQTLVITSKAKGLIENTPFCEDSASLTKVVLPDGLTKIYSECFKYNVILKDINIPTSVTEIGAYAFFNTLVDVDFSKLTKLKSIGYQAFFRSSIYGGDNGYLIQTVASNPYGGLTNIVLPSSVTYVDNSAFYGQVNVKKVVIPESVAKMYNGSFQFLNSMEELTVNANMDEILSSEGGFGVQAWNHIFWNGRTSSLKKIVLGKNVTQEGAIPWGLFFGLSASDIEIQFPYTKIGYGAFANMPNLETFTLDKNVTEIGAGAFMEDPELTTLLNTSNVEKIGMQAFENDTNLENISLSSVKEIGKFAFDGVQGMETMILPASLERIYIGAFQNTNLSKIVLLGNNTKLSVPVIEESDENDYPANYEVVLSQSEAALLSTAQIEQRLLNSLPIPAGITIQSDSTDAAFLKYVSDVGNTKIALDATNPYLTVGATEITKSVSDPDFNINASARFGTIQYSSSDVTVATVDAGGKVTLVKPGNVNITAKVPASDTCDEATITVALTVTGNTQTISVPSKSVSLEVGKTAKLGATAKTTLKYSSSNTSVATVSSTGKITAVGVGTATITIKAARENNYAAAKRTVTVSVSKGANTVTGPATSITKGYGENFNLNATAKTGLSYASSNTSVAVVSSTGDVTLKGLGTTTITITAAETANYKSGRLSVTLTVVKGTPTITVPSESYAKTLLDSAFSIGASSTSTLSYTSSNTSVVTVSSSGKVTIKGVGTATVTVKAASSSKYNEATKTVTITVTKATNTITATTKSYKTTAAKLSTASKSFTIGATATAGAVTYSVTDTASKNYITVTSAGKVTIKQGTPVGTYSVIVRAAETDKYKSAKLTVKITVN